MLYIITPTFNRPRRLDFIRRLTQWLSQCPVDFLWVVVEDGAVDPELRRIIAALNAEYLSCGPTRDWGNSQRTEGLRFVLNNTSRDGVVYFADDDNDFDPELHNELSAVQNVGIMPVGNLGPHGIEGPIVRNGRIVGWDAHWHQRKFPTDMAGFAVHTKLIRARLGNQASFPKIKGGETEFLESLNIEVGDLEILCTDCTKCYAWHNHPLHRPKSNG